MLYARYGRPWQLTWGATPAAVSRPLPGDELVTRPTFNATRAITIAAPPDIWMMRKMLLNLRDRAEGLGTGPARSVALAG